MCQLRTVQEGRKGQREKKEEARGNGSVPFGLAGEEATVWTGGEVSIKEELFTFPR